MCGSCCMIIIINIKLNTISCKSSGIFYYIFHTIHNDMGSHRYKRIRCIYCDRMISCRHRTAGCRSSTPLPTADGAVTIPTGDNLSQWFSYPNCLCFGNCLPGRICRNTILLTENGLYLLCYFIISKTTVFYGQIRDQLIWIMSDFINLVPVFIVIRMRGFHLIDLRI